MRFYEYGRKILLCVGAAASFGMPAAYGAGEGEWNKATPAPLPTQVLPLLNVKVDEHTDEITFVNTNNDPFVHVRVYPLKYADPYEIRPYIEAAIKSKRVDSNYTKVEAIKYADGTGMLIVSAEDYRFGEVPNGMSLEKIIAELDKPGLASAAGRKFFLYFPKYFDAPTLAGIIRKVGLTSANDDVELQGGIDTVKADAGLNALLFYCSPFSAKHINAMLREYDAPATEAKITYTIYELERENDGNLGLDFQAWKNGPGMDLFSIAARYSNGWDFLANSVAGNLVKESHTSFINFNPKWNSKYLDFLVAKSHGRIVTSGSLSIMNRCTGSVESVTRMPYIEEDGKETVFGGSTTLLEYMTIDAWSGDYALSAVTQNGGHAIEMPSGYTGSLTVTRTTVNGRVYYNLEIAAGASLRVEGVNIGNTVKAYDVAVTCTDNSVIPAVTTVMNDYRNDYATTVGKDKPRKTGIAEFGFTMHLTPEVNSGTSILKIDMRNTNLIGFKNNGEPRNSLTELTTQVQLANDGSEFYIGGLEKSAVTRSVNKVPFLGDIPLIGFLFSAESEAVKKTDLVAVLRVEPLAPDTVVEKSLKDESDAVKGKLKKFGTKAGFYDENDYGFDQFLLDGEKKKLDE